MALVDDYQSAVASGDTTTANYLAQMLAAQAGININTNQVTAAPNSMVNPAPSSTTATSGNDWLDNLLNGLDTAFPSTLGALDSIGGSGAPAPDAGSAGAAVVSGVQGAGSFLSLLGDIPRLGTIIVGGLMIAAGLFGLAGGSHKDVIQLVTSKTKAVAAGGT